MFGKRADGIYSERLQEGVTRCQEGVVFARRIACTRFRWDKDRLHSRGKETSAESLIALARVFMEQGAPSRDPRSTVAVISSVKLKLRVR